MPYNQGLRRAQGDPGFFSFIGKALRTVGSIIPGPIGAGVQAIGGVLAPAAPTPVPIIPQLPVLRPAAPLIPGVAAPAPPAQLVAGCPPGAGAPRGMRLNKSSYFLRDGTFVQAGTRFVKSRRRDPLNIRALRRANSRQRGFLRAVDATLKTMPTKAGVSKRRRQIGGAK